MTTALVADGRDAETAGGGEDGVALLARDQLGVEIAGAARRGDALEEGDVAGEEDEAVAVVGELVGEGLPYAVPRCSAAPPPPSESPRSPGRARAHPRSSIASATVSSWSVTRCAPRIGRTPAASQARWNSTAP